MYWPDSAGLAPERGGTYSSLVNASLAMMARDVPKLMLCVGSMGGDRHRLRNKMRERSLAVLDRDGTGLRSTRFALALL